MWGGGATHHTPRTTHIGWAGFACPYFLRRRRPLRRKRRRLLPIFLLPLCFFGYPMGLYRLTTSLLIKSHIRKHTYRVCASPRLVDRSIHPGPRLLSTSAQPQRSRQRQLGSKEFQRSSGVLFGRAMLSKTIPQKDLILTQKTGCLSLQRETI